MYNQDTGLFEVVTGAAHFVYKKIKTALKHRRSPVLSGDLMVLMGTPPADNTCAVSVSVVWLGHDGTFSSMIWETSLWLLVFRSRGRNSVAQERKTDLFSPEWLLSSIQVLSDQAVFNLLRLTKLLYRKVSGIQFYCVATIVWNSSALHSHPSHETRIIWMFKGFNANLTILLQPV